MGFNIATARLGDETLFLSATEDSETWEGVKIDFDQMEDDESYAAAVVSMPKGEMTESGTKVVIRKLKNGYKGLIPG